MWCVERQNSPIIHSTNPTQMTLQTLNKMLSGGAHHCFVLISEEFENQNGVGAARQVKSEYSPVQFHLYFFQPLFGNGTGVTEISSILSRVKERLHVSVLPLFQFELFQLFEQSGIILDRAQGNWQVSSFLFQHVYSSVEAG